MELRRYWEIIWRRKAVILQSVILIPFIAFLVMNTVSQIYKVKAKLWVNMNTLQQKFIRDIPAEIGRIEFSDTGNAMGTIEEMMESSPVVGKVIHDMGLKDKRGDLFEEKGFIDPNILKILLQKKGIKIENLSDSDTFEVIGFSDCLGEAREIAERVIKEFLNMFSRRYKTDAEKAKKTITHRLQEVGGRLKLAEQALNDFRVENKIFSTTTQINTLISDISTLETLREETFRSIQENRAIVESLEKASLNDPKAFKEVRVRVEDDPTVLEYKNELLTFETNLAKLSVERTSEHPDIKQVKKQIDVVKSNIKQEISKSFASQIVEKTTFYSTLATKYADAMAEVIESTIRERVLVEQIKEKQKELSDFPKKEEKYTELSREADNLRSIYNSLFTSLENARSASEMDLANIFIVQPPKLSKNLNDHLYFPPSRKKLYYLLAVFVGIVWGIFVAVFLEYIDHSLRSVQDVETWLNQKVAGIVPNIRRRDRKIKNIARSPITDSVCSLLANIKLFKGDEYGKVISLVSPMRGEGKSVLASFLAGTLAQQGKKVMLIDGNLRHPFLHKLFGLPSGPGLGDYLATDMNLQDIIHPVPIGHLDVIPHGSIPVANPQKYLDSDKFSGLIKTFMVDYDIILLDTPAFTHGSDALILARHGEEVIFIVEQGKTPQKRAQHFMEAIQRTKMKPPWIVLNKVKYL
jgi:succinoglycan biosynthesis transport protein ExoP